MTTVKLPLNIYSKTFNFCLTISIDCLEHYVCGSKYLHFTDGQICQD